MNPGRLGIQTKNGLLSCSFGHHWSAFNVRREAGLHSSIGDGLAEYRVSSEEAYDGNGWKEKSTHSITLRNLIKSENFVLNFCFFSNTGNTVLKRKV